MAAQTFTLRDLASRFIGIAEVPGSMANPAIMAMLKLDAEWPEDDAVPWCSAFVNACAFLRGLERTKSLRARSWLQVGEPVPLAHASGNCVVILSRGKWQPGPEVIKAPGHVGVYMGHTETHVTLLGGNQGNRVSVRDYPRARLLGVRRLRPE